MQMALMRTLVFEDDGLSTSARDGRTPGGSRLRMLNTDLEEAHLTAEAEAVISLKKRHCVSAGITTSGSLGRSTATARGEMRQALHRLLENA